MTPCLTTIPTPSHSCPMPEMMALRSRRVIVYGAESDVGRAVHRALRDAGAIVAVTSRTTDGAALFALKRVAAGGPAQAVDLSNATNVRVATRKLAKELGGLDVAVLIPDPTMSEALLDGAVDVAARELQRAEAGRIIVLGETPPHGSTMRSRDVPLDRASGDAVAADPAAFIQMLARPPTAT
jgi:hypothetical protein